MKNTVEYVILKDDPYRKLIESMMEASRDVYQHGLKVQKSRERLLSAEDLYQVEEVGENYTSQTSVIDRERPVPENAKKSRRKKRGLFKSNEHIPIQADLNSAYQIACKVVNVNYTSSFIRSVKKTKIV